MVLCCYRRRIKKADQSSTNLSNPSAWQNLSGTSGLSDGAVNNIVAINNKMLAQKMIAYLFKTIIAGRSSIPTLPGRSLTLTVMA